MIDHPRPIGWSPDKTATGQRDAAIREAVDAICTQTEMCWTCAGKGVFFGTARNAEGFIPIEKCPYCHGLGFGLKA